MRIAFVLGLPNPLPGAGWTRLSSFARRLRQEGHTVDVLGVVSPKHLARAGVRRAEPARIVNLCPAISSDSPWALAFNLVAAGVVLPLVLRILRPGLVLVSVPAGPPLLAARIGARIAGARLVIDYRDEWEDYALSRAGSGGHRRALQRLKAAAARAYRSSDLVLAVSDSLAAALRARGVAGVHVVPNGADVTVFRPRDKTLARRRLGLREDDLVLVYEGTIGYYYRLDTVVRAVAVARAAIPRLTLVLVGPDPERHVGGLRALAADLGSGDRLVYLGATESPDDLAGILSAADLGLVPYDDNPLWRNAMPAKFFEYAACGLPVVATVPDDSVLARTIRERELGRSVPPGDESGLATALEVLARDPAERRRLGENGRRLIVESYDRGALAGRFTDLLRPFLGGQR